MRAIRFSLMRQTTGYNYIKVMVSNFIQKVESHYGMGVRFIWDKGRAGHLFEGDKALGY
jgi:hypothetical protein